MKRQKEADILGSIIRLAKNGLTQASIASSIGIKPSKVYKICKRYGIKTESFKEIMMEVLSSYRSHEILHKVTW